MSHLDGAALPLDGPGKSAEEMSFLCLSVCDCVSSLLGWMVSLATAGRWTGWSLKVPSNPTRSISVCL